MRKHVSVIVAVLFTVISCFGLTSCKENETPPAAPEAKAVDWWDEDFETTPLNDAEFLERIGGFACGVCHPNENYSQIKEANIEWVRFDIKELPFDEAGNLTESYKSFKERAKGYADAGIKVMAITPYPKKYIAAGLDPRDEASRAEIMKIARFYAEDLQGIVSAFQITNEMGIEHFTLPLTWREAADFVGMQLKAMYRYKGDIVIGYNLAGASYAGFNNMMKPYMQYVDYVGADIYLGCFEDVFSTLDWYTRLLGTARQQTGKPIMLNEFGYIGAGQAKSDAEKLSILRRYGAIGDTYDEAEAYTKDHMDVIVNNPDFPSSFREHLKLICSIDEVNMTAEELAEAYKAMGAKLYSGDLACHLYSELKGGYQLKDYEHTHEGQAEFFTDCFEEQLFELDYLCGAFVYCYSDSDSCYVCGQADCPVETGWGLVDGNGDPKPSYYAVQEQFGSVND